MRLGVRERSPHRRFGGNASSCWVKQKEKRRAIGSQRRLGGRMAVVGLDPDLECLPGPDRGPILPAQRQTGLLGNFFLPDEDFHFLLPLLSFC